MYEGYHVTNGTQVLDAQGRMQKVWKTEKRNISVSSEWGIERSTHEILQERTAVNLMHSYLKKFYERSE